MSPADGGPRLAQTADTPPRAVLAPAPSVAAEGPGSGAQKAILRSSALMASASAVNMVLGMARTKAMALLLDPAGIGVWGAYMQLADLARALAQMGTNASGVRQVAEAVASDDPSRVVRTGAALVWTAVACGALGALALVLGREPLSRLAFGNTDHAQPIAWLGAAVFFGVVAGALGALLQGLRRIADLAWLSVLGTLAGTVSGVALVGGLGPAGLAPSLVLLSLATLVVSGWLARRATGPWPRVTLAAVVRESRPLLRLGWALMFGGLAALGVAFCVRTLVLRHAGLEAAGYYQAAWTLGGLYAGFVLQAMAADFYPRLVSAIDHPTLANGQVNEQAQVSLALAGPGVVATLTLAPWILPLFYSREFAPAVGVLRWICLGMALRVITWPLGYLLVALNRHTLLIATEGAWAAVTLGLSWVCIAAFGMEGAGVAFALSYVFHAAVVWVSARRLTGFQWSAVSRGAGARYLAGIALAFLGGEVLPAGLSLAFGLALTGALTLHSASALRRMSGRNALPQPILRMLRRIGIAA